MSSVLQFLRVQDAVRKKRPPSFAAGAWTGCIAQSIGSVVFLNVTLEKWEKGKKYILMLEEK